MTRKVWTASAMGKKGGPLGGRARAAKLSKKRRSAIASQAVNTLWKKIGAQVNRDEGWMLAGDAAKFLGTTIANLHYHAERGTIPYREVAVGKRICRIYREKDLLEYRKKNRT